MKIDEFYEKKDNGRWYWYLINPESDHVLAQGCTRTEKGAYSAAERTRASLLHSLGLVAVPV